MRWVVVAGLLIAAILACGWVQRSKLGTLLLAMRDKEDRVRFSGYDVAMFKVFAFCLAAALSAVDPASRRAVVMTMGALHAGHLQLVREARALVGPSGHVTVTIFVNPTQFAPGEDLASYPRTFDADLAACREEDR